MRFFTFVLFSLLLLFGVVLEGYGQGPGGGGGGVDCNECIPRQNQRGNLVVREIFLSDESGNRISADECNSSTPVTEFWITILYSSEADLYNVKLLFDLVIIDKITELEVDRERFTYLVEEPVLSASIDEPRTIRLSIKLDNGTFDCKNQRLEFFDLQNFYTLTENLNASTQCGGYPPGLCSVAPSLITPVGVDGFIYDFDYRIDCLEGNESKISTRFFVSSFAGGLPEYDITWTLTINDNINEITGVFEFEEEFDGGENVKVKLKIIPSNVASLNPDQIIEPDVIDFSIPLPINPIIYDEDLDKKDNVLTEAITPNGFIDVELKEGDFSFFWISEDGTFFNNQDLSIDGLSEGVYILNVTELDENGQPTGACRVYRFDIFDVTPQPVIYNEISIEFIENIRTNKFSWSTTKEWEASHFEIDRATQGINFERVGEVKAAGWSDQLVEYVFEDKMLPLTGGNLLYRLKQVDFNGDYHYSEVLSVRIPGVEFTQGVWRAYPNPTDGNALRINLMDASQYNQEALTFRLIHPMIQTQPISVASENDMNEAMGDLSRRMPKGVFVVEIQWGQKVEHIKVLKQ
jgi:hypothetical protein